MGATLWRIVAIFLSVYLPVVSFGPSNNPVSPTHVKLTQVADGLSDVTDIAHADDGRLFVTEQRGIIRVVAASALLATPFLDITTQVACCGERGLLGLAFDPDYAHNGRFYVNYTYIAAGNALRSRVARFNVSAGDPNRADAASETILLEFAQPFDTHNGGALHFGPDGYLYIATGDGGNGYDPLNNSQNTGVLLGKILRIDVNATGGADCGLAPGRSYGIPAGNPLQDGPGGACDEIWAYGLRNPWRVSFDHATGDLWIADVGQDAREEINFQPADSSGGQNWGWDCWEGTQQNGIDPSPACGSNPTTVRPVYEYIHAGGRCSIVGGYVYRGQANTPFTGWYFFADYCSAEIWVLKQVSGAVAVTKLAVSGATLANPRTFGEDAQGELYVASPGAIYRLDDAGG